MQIYVYIYICEGMYIYTFIHIYTYVYIYIQYNTIHNSVWTMSRQLTIPRAGPERLGYDPERPRASEARWRCKPVICPEAKPCGQRRQARQIANF